MATVITETENRREISDDFSGRVFKVEWRCAGCGQWVDEEDAVWVDGRAYHVSCAL